MKRIWTIPLASLLIIAGCSTVPNVQTGTLRCKYPWDAGGFIGFYSFTAGELTPPISHPEPGQVDLILYYDRGDCSQGALMSGVDESPGYLFPIGQESWRQLAKLKPPSEDSKSVAAIAPLIKDKEGLALWVKTGRGEYFLVSIRKVQPATYKDLVSGDRPALELEWLGPQNSGDNNGL